MRSRGRVGSRSKGWRWVGLGIRGRRWVGRFGLEPFNLVSVRASCFRSIRKNKRPHNLSVGE